MKEPRIKYLKIDRAETTKIRSRSRQSGTVKITINIDASSLEKLKREASRTGVPYQRLLNRVLKDALLETTSADERLRRLEREVASIKKKLAA